MLDVFVIGILIFFFVSGFLKGVVSQLATIAGIIVAFLFAKPLAPLIVNISVALLGTSEDASRMIAPVIAGITLYFAVVLLGKLFETQLVNKVSGLKSVNRLGGAGLSTLKGVVIIMVMLFLLHFIPATLVDAWAPKLYQSKTYQLSLSHNPLGTKDIIQRFQHYRAQKKAAKEQAQDKQEKKNMEEVIGDYLMEQALENPEQLMKDLSK